LLRADARGPPAAAHRPDVPACCGGGGAPISRVAAVHGQAGAHPMIAVYALCTGFIELDRASMVSDLAPGQTWTVPVPSFLVDHPRGRLLFDTGVHCQARLDPVGRLGAERVKRLTVKSKEGDDVVPQLARLDLTPADVRYVANSHLHFDHCGGNEFFPHAT